MDLFPSCVGGLGIVSYYELNSVAMTSSYCCYFICLYDSIEG